jgi:putative ABC transport system permease protein
MLILKIAFRNILRQKRRSMLTGLSMAGGYILCVLSFSLVEGSYGNIIDIFTLDHTGHIQVHKDNYLRRPKIYKTITDRQAVETVLADNDDVSNFTPRVFAPALAYAGNKTSPVQVLGVDVVLEPTTSRLAQKVQRGAYLDANPDDKGYFKAMIGQGIADTLLLDIGDEIVLISQGADGSIANDIFIISAVVGNRTSYDRLGVYLPLQAAQTFLSLGNSVHEYAIVIENKNDSETVARNLQDELTGLKVSPWQEVEETFYRTMQSDKQGNHFTLGIVIFIVFIGVLNTVLMSVLERTREFGVLRAIGSRPVEIIKMIFLETTLLACISIGIGVILSAPLIGWFTQVGILLPEPVDMGGIEFQYMKGEFSWYVFTVPMLLILGFSAAVSIPPGLRAAHILPRDALGSH